MAKTVSPEFSFIVHPAEIAAGGEAAVFELEASPAECAALARRFGFVAIERFRATVGLRPMRGGDGFRLEGRIRACVTQTCVVTLEPVVSEVDREFGLLLLEEADHAGDPLELEEDFDLYSGDTIDIGEIAAEELALSLDPYPRAADAGTATPGPGGNLAESEHDRAGEATGSNAFGALAALKRSK